MIQDASGWLNPIDAHFYFDSRFARNSALQMLGLLTVEPTTPEERAKRGKIGGLDEILAQVPDVPPLPGDEK